MRFANLQTATVVCANSGISLRLKIQFVNMTCGRTECSANNSSCFSVLPHVSVSTEMC